MSLMPVHDHEKRPEGGVFCPLMKEICYSGWTPSMGVSQDVKKLKPTCARWTGVFIKRGIEAPIEEVFDCKDRWDTDMLQQIAQEIYQGAAATESVRNHVAENTGVAKIVQSFFLQLADAAGYKLKLPAPPPVKKKELELIDPKGDQ